MVATGCADSDPTESSSKASKVSEASKVTDGPQVPWSVADAPDGWCEKWSVTLTSPDGLANVIVSSEPVDPSMDSEAYADSQGDLLRDEFPGYDETSLEEDEVFGMSGFVREFRWTPADAAPVRQLQSYAADDGTGFVATATAAARDFDDFHDELVEVMRGARATSPTSRSADGCELG
jgi:hypothetical protein